jgi:hypothetical protein
MSAFSHASTPVPDTPAPPASISQQLEADVDLQASEAGGGSSNCIIFDHFCTYFIFHFTDVHDGACTTLQTLDIVQLVSTNIGLQFERQFTSWNDRIHYARNELHLTQVEVERARRNLANEIGGYHW